jgi:hypothetical protein
MEIGDVSPERAKEMGIEVRSHANGEAGVAVIVEFKAEGALKNIARAELHLGADGKVLADAPLQTTEEDGATLQTRFSVDPSLLAQSHLMLVVTNRTRTIIGHRLELGAFVGQKS